MKKLNQLRIALGLFTLTVLGIVLLVIFWPEQKPAANEETSVEYDSPSVDEVFALIPHNAILIFTAQNLNTPLREFGLLSDEEKLVLPPSIQRSKLINFLVNTALQQSQIDLSGVIALSLHKHPDGSTPSINMYLPTTNAQQTAQLLSTYLSMQKIKVQQDTEGENTLYHSQLPSDNLLHALLQPNISWMGMKNILVVSIGPTQNETLTSLRDIQTKGFKSAKSEEWYTSVQTIQKDRWHILSFINPIEYKTLLPFAIPNPIRKPIDNFFGSSSGIGLRAFISGEEVKVSAIASLSQFTSPNPQPSQFVANLPESTLVISKVAINIPWIFELISDNFLSLPPALDKGIAIAGRLLGIDQDSIINAIQSPWTFGYIPEKGKTGTGVIAIPLAEGHGFDKLLERLEMVLDFTGLEMDIVRTNSGNWYHLENLNSFSPYFAIYKDHFVFLVGSDQEDLVNNLHNQKSIQMSNLQRHFTEQMDLALYINGSELKNYIPHLPVPEIESLATFSSLISSISQGIIAADHSGKQIRLDVTLLSDTPNGMGTAFSQNVLPLLFSWAAQ